MIVDYISVFAHVKRCVVCGEEFVSGLGIFGLDEVAESDKEKERGFIREN